MGVLFAFVAMVVLLLYTSRLHWAVQLQWMQVVFFYPFVHPGGGWGIRRRFQRLTDLMAVLFWASTLRGGLRMIRLILGVREGKRRWRVSSKMSSKIEVKSKLYFKKPNDIGPIQCFLTPSQDWWIEAVQPYSATWPSVTWLHSSASF